MYELKKIGKVFTSKFVWTGPSSYKKRNLPGRELTKVEKHCPKKHCPKKNCPKKNCPKKHCPKKHCPKKHCPKKQCPKKHCPKPQWLMRIPPVLT